MSVNNFLLELIDNLYAEINVLRNQIEERQNRNNALRQELEESQICMEQFSKAYFDLNSTMCHSRATYEQLQGKVEHFAIFEKLIFAITLKVLRILMKDIKRVLASNTNSS